MAWYFYKHIAVHRVVSSTRRVNRKISTTGGAGHTDTHSVDKTKKKNRPLNLSYFDFVLFQIYPICNLC